MRARLGGTAVQAILMAYAGFHQDRMKLCCMQVPDLW